MCFKAYALRCLHPEVKLHIRSDDGTFDTTVKMEWTELNADGEDVYEYTLDTADMCGLYWYSADDKVYQLSVYDENIAPPDWYGKGVTYHIFVDRFNRGNKNPIENDADFYVHANLHDAPHYLPHEINRDIYGGDLKGIKEKLPYLKSLGVGTIYLSPIFEAWSNHKYNTANFAKIDSHFGDEEDLKQLCNAAAKMGMRIILDGVFNHVGSDSVYFNKDGRYKTLGAWQGESSEYYKWFSFTGDTYDSWWGILTLPSVRENEPGYMAHIADIARHWLKCGISGWRLDVADELPDEFLRHFYETVKNEKKDALIVGEVWEDASNKIAYSVRRKYFTERELDGVMNYPLREAILGFVSERISADDASQTMKTLCLHYPKPILNCLMNHIGTHDTLRALTALARPDISNLPRERQAEFKLTDDEINLAKTRLCRAAVLQYAFPGSPTIYYGDEAGMQGGADPFNRAYYPWGNEDKKLIEFYRMLGWFKNNAECMQNGDFEVCVKDNVLILSRNKENQTMLFCVSNSAKNLFLNTKSDFFDAISGESYRAHLGYLKVKIPKCGYLLLTNDCKLIYNKQSIN